MCGISIHAQGFSFSSSAGVAIACSWEKIVSARFTKSGPKSAASFLRSGRAPVFVHAARSRDSCQSKGRLVLCLQPITFMRVAVAADHIGFRLKEVLIPVIESLGHEVIDLGTHSRDPVDYPDYAVSIGRVIRDNLASRAILLCGSGVGASIAANKIRGLRAALCHDVFSAHQSVEDDDANVLCLGANVVGERLAEDLVQTWMAARFSNLERHRRRVDKVLRLERDAA